jgi:ribosomal protein L16 Arg81 hydroxylase
MDVLNQHWQKKNAAKKNALPNSHDVSVREIATACGS